MPSRFRIALIVLVALAMRLVDVGEVPVELHADELAGLVGIHQILSGRAPLVPFFDLRVQYLPLYGIFESLATAVLGPTAFAVRIPAVLLGVVSTLALRGLAYELTASWALADGAAAIFAVLPWAVDVSRLGWENAAVFPFLLGGLAALARGFRCADDRAIVVSGFLFGIGAYSYRAELFDAILLGGALALADAGRIRERWRALVVTAGVAAVIVAPLAIAVSLTPHFFWRDANIATFGHGYTSAAFATFARNYAAHFALAPLFASGDGILDHGPAYGVLYWWMLPFIVLGAVTARETLGPRNAAFAYAWLAIYPLGGALTNDGVPDFPRTMIGAPLAALLAAAGVACAWQMLRDAGLRKPVRGAALIAFSCVVALSTVDFLHAYLVVYPDASANAFKAGTAELFAAIRARERDHARVCFASLDWYNYATLTQYYLAGSNLVAVEGTPAQCVLGGSLVVVDDPSKTVPGSRLIATERKRDGTVFAYIFET